MKIILFLILFPILANAQSQNDLYYLNINQKLFQSNQSQQKSEIRPFKAYLHGLVGSFSVGIFGAFIGTQLETNCSGSSDVLRICQGTDKYTHHGAAIGGTLGSSISIIHYTKKSNVKYKNLKIIIGSAIGGIAGFALSKKTYALSSFLLPPVGAIIALNF